jgi:hypothetical protein
MMIPRNRGSAAIVGGCWNRLRARTGRRRGDFVAVAAIGRSAPEWRL